MSAASAQLPRPGDMIAGKYVLERLIGQGGMGAVFAARHLKLSKAVAIKIMLADASSPEASTRFVNEGRAAANIQNEHVVRVDDVDEEMGYAYMVLELLEGEDLSQVLERESNHRLAPHVAVGYVIEALKGVMQAHAIGIVHRDLKPSNLFLAKRKDGSVVVKVLDFGISKAQGSSALAASPSALTSTKAMLGSPLYMSPEQLRSSKSVDHRADIWAMGIILYELITGTLPFMGDNLGELFAAILETDPPPLRQRTGGVHAGLEEVVLRCLQRKPEHRFQSVGELVQALQPYANALAAHDSVGGPSQLAGTAVLGAGAIGAITPGAMSSGAITPGAVTPGGMVRPQLPSTGSTTGSGPRMVGGTVALGAITPQGLQHQTGSGWQNTSGNTLSKSKAPMIAAAVVAGVLLLVGVTGILLYLKSTKDKSEVGSGTTASSGVVAPPPSASIVVTPPPPPPDPIPSAPPQSSTSAPVAPATVAVAPKPQHNGTVPKPPDSPKPADAPPTPTPKPVPVKPTPSSNLQNAR